MIDQQAFRNILDTAPIGVHYYELRPDGALVLLYANCTADSVLGVGKGQHIGKSIEEAFPPLKATPTLETFRRIAKDGGELSARQTNNRVEVSNALIEVRGTQIAPRLLALFFKEINGSSQGEWRRESENLFRAVFDEGPVGMAIVGPDLHFIRANASFCKMTGYTEQELASLTLAEITHPAHAAEDIINVKRLSNGEIPFYRTEKRYICKDRGLVWGDVTVSVVRRDDGQSMQFLAIIEDITDRKNAEEARREIEERQSAILQMMPMVLYRAQTPSPYDATWMTFNVEQVTGFPMTMFTTQPGFWTARIHPNDRDHVMSQFEDIRKGKPADMEYRWLRADGSYRWFQDRVVTVCSQDDYVVEYFGVWLDITERRQAEQEFQESEERYRELVEGARDVIYVLSPEGVFTSLNKAFETITGWRREEWLGRTFNELVHPDDLPEAIGTFIEVLNGLQGAQTELRIRMTSGRYFTGEFKATRHVIHGKTVGVFGIARDVTQRKELEEQVRHSQKMESIGLLAGGIAHDFNNILGIILGNADLLKRGGPEEQQRHTTRIEAITKATTRGSDLVRQLLTLARKTETRRQTVMVNNLVRETEKLLEETFPKTITISLTLAQDLPPIAADASQLQQVLINLSVNAKDAMPNGGVLSFTTRSISGQMVAEKFPKSLTTEYVAIDVADTGMGMDSETVKHMFDPFFTTKEIGNGTGLGLSVVFSIMQYHSGFIDVASEIGKGTTFHLYLPVVQNQAKESESTPDETSSSIGGTETLLVVEDEEMLIELLTSFLELHGYTILMARNGEEAACVYAKHQDEISLVLSDLGLPKFDGEELFRRLKAMNPAVRCVIASGFVEPDKKARLLEAGVKDVIHKPYLPGEVLRKIRQALDGKLD